jgi:hypothetical protein
MDTEINHQLERRVHAIVSEYVMESEGRQMSHFLLDPVLNAVVEYPERPAPFHVLSCLLVEFKRWKKAEPVLRAATKTLRTLGGLFSAETLPSLKVYPALQACLLVLEGRLKPPAVDGIASACFYSLQSRNWAHKVGALEVLATLVRCSCSAHGENEKSDQRTLLTDFLDLAAMIAQRQAQFDPSERVREAACSLLSTIECPVDIVGILGTENEKSNSAASIEPYVVNSTTKGTEYISGDIAKPNAPIPLALTPLPAFSKELSEDELCWKEAPSPPARAASASIGSVPNSIHHSPDAFSMLASDIQSIDSAIEMDIQTFLRGSILPADAGFGGKTQRQQQCVEQEEDIYSEGWDDILNPSCFSNNNNEEEEESKLGSGTDADTLIRHVLVHALEQYYNEQGTAPSNFNLTTRNIEEILRTCLDLHSEQAYEHHLQRAEALLVRSSQQLRGKPHADAELQRQVHLLEKDVHRAVAEQQSQFMESVVPEIADILANPQILERLLVH